MPDASLPMVHVIKVTDKGRLAFMSFQFPSRQLHVNVGAVVRRLLRNDKTGIAPVEFLGEGETDFCLQLLRPLADDRTIDSFLRALSNAYGFRTEVVAMTIEALDAQADAELDRLLRRPTQPE